VTGGWHRHRVPYLRLAVTLLLTLLASVTAAYSAALPVSPSGAIAPLDTSTPATPDTPAMTGAGSVPFFPKKHQKEQPAKLTNEPVVLEADHVDFDNNTHIATALGHVSVTQGESIVLAEKLSYNQDTGQIYAQGNVSMLEPSGNVYFADQLELHNQMKSGVIKQFKARLPDKSQFVAVQANRIDENRTELFKAAYSPCNANCNKDDPNSPPLWQLRADHVLIDESKQEVTYDDTYFDVYGVPVFYSPYMSHATPGADNESGMLSPTYTHSTLLGSVIKVPVYYVIGQDKDFTITPMETTNSGPVMIGEYRQMFDAGPLQLGGSITSAPNIDALGNPIPGHEIRGDLSAKGNFQIDNTYDWGFDARRASDDTYLQLYDFSHDTLLTSRAFIEGSNFPGTNDRSYAVLQALSFQGLTGQDNAMLIPKVAPLADATWQSDAGWENSRFKLSADAMSLYTESGPDSRRLSGTAGWQLPYISSDGQVIQFSTQLRTDVYNVSNVLQEDGSTFNGTTGREVPEVSTLWRYPFINQLGGTSSVMIEPVVFFAASPNGGNPSRIPNEDSLVPEFNDTNLFSDNRFAGLDRVEGGPRVSYGLRGQAQVMDNKYLDWVFGQEYRVDNDPNFPISTDTTSHLSDYVGRVGVNYAPVALAYRFSLDKDNFSPVRNEVDTSYTLYPINIAVSYLELKHDPVLANRQQITASSTVNLTKEWLWIANANRDLLVDQFVTLGTGLAYQNECTIIAGVVNREYFEVEDIKPSTTFQLRVFLKNLE
jgi:LPS-assembly protein